MATLIVKTQGSDEQYASMVRIGGRGLFCSKETRDRVAALIPGARKSSVRSQQLHPEYVTDFVGQYHTGFGNTDYQTYWSVLYQISVGV